MSKTKRALALYDAQPLDEKNIHAAARQADIKAPTLFNALKRRDEQKAAGRRHCPCCGQVLREGFSVRQEALAPEYRDG